MKYNYFELSEFIKSETAKKNGIDNTPTFEAVEHLGELVAGILDPLRAAYGQPIKVTSGFRSPALNRAVGGSSTNVHQIGYAADLQVSGSFAKFRDFVKGWFASTGTKFDQLLIEKDSSGKRWIHIGMYSNSREQRGIVNLLNK